MSVCAGIKWVHQQCLLFILGKIQGRIMGFFCRKLYKNEGNWTERSRDARTKFYYVDPPMKTLRMH